MIGEYPRHQRFITDVSLNYYGLCTQHSDVRTLDLRVVVVIEIVQNHDLLTGRNQTRGQATADKPCTTCDKCRHYPSLACGAAFTNPGALQSTLDKVLITHEQAEYYKSRAALGNCH
jgi:hypothetical protein